MQVQRHWNTNTLVNVTTTISNTTNIPRGGGLTTLEQMSTAYTYIHMHLQMHQLNKLGNYQKMLILQSRREGKKTCFMTTQHFNLMKILVFNGKWKGQSNEAKIKRGRNQWSQTLLMMHNGFLSLNHEEYEHVKQVNPSAKKICTSIFRIWRKQRGLFDMWQVCDSDKKYSGDGRT